MSKLKLIAIVACFSLLSVGSASADPWGRHHRGYYRGYGPPIYGYPPVIVAAPPPPVVYGPAYGYPPPAYVAPPPVVYGPPAYTYGAIGPRGRFGVGYVTPGVGVYIGR